MNRGSDTGPRSVWVGFSVFLSIVSVALEVTAHLCASVFFDPLPNVVSVLAYLSLPVLVLLNRQVLVQAEDGLIEPRKLGWTVGLAITGSAVGLVIAAIYTLLFLPVMPVGAVAVIAYGLGLCAFSPFVNLAVLGFQLGPLLRRWREYGGPVWRLAPACLLAGVIPFTALVGHPAAIGFCYQRAITTTPREPSLAWLRRLDGDETVLELCYQRRNPAWVSLGRWLAGGPAVDTNLYNFRGMPTQDNNLTQARRIYYLLTGRPYESVRMAGPAFSRASWDDWEPVSNEQGGELVGHAVEGLSLASSRIDGVLDAKSETAYCEWTMVFENSTAFPAEARADLLLPEGGVVDKVSLWIDGEERPAAFGARAVVREAYQEVAVAQRRDPLLVTAKRPDRVMAQCFPVPASGKMQIRIGMSAPLIWEDRGGPALCFGTPGFQQVNFRMPETLQHEVWLEGKRPDNVTKWMGQGWAFSESMSDGKPVLTARRNLKAQEILRPPVAYLAGGRKPQLGERPSRELTRTTPTLAPVTKPVDLALVLDTSRGMDGALAADAWRQLESAVKELPAGSRVRLVDGRQLADERRPTSTGWTDAAALNSLKRWWRGRQFAGGTEPASALSWAVDEALGVSNPSAVVWLHGAVPADLVDATHLTQTYERRPNGPALVGVQLRPGPDALSDELGANRRVFALAVRSGEDTVAKAVRLAARAATGVRSDGIPLGGREPAINGLRAAVGDARNHAANRLAAQSAVLAAWYSGLSTNKEAAPAQKLAIRRRLVTPLSGAVVLETKEQYARYELSDAAAEGSIPSVPEPGTMVLLAAAGALGAGHRLRRFRLRRRGALPEGGAIQ